MTNKIYEGVNLSNANRKVSLDSKAEKLHNMGSGTSEEFRKARHQEHIQQNTGDASRMPPQMEHRPDLDHPISDSGDHRDKPEKSRSNLTDKTTSKTKRNDAVKKR
jgi:hypothetical protein